MFASGLVDSALIRLFRFRTRGFLKMQETDGRVPPVPAEGGCYLYVHVPFCEVLCPFCSFHRVQHCHDLAVRYFAALRTEIRRYHEAGFKFSGVYFGGGTPTTEPDELLATIALVKELFGVKEVSVETNPKDLQEPLLSKLRAGGVTRLSVGVQSFDDQLLQEMDRYAKYGSGADTAERIRNAAAMFPTFNVDLIFNQPHQTVASLERDLEIFLSLGANQVSCYPLMTSPTTLRRMQGAMGTPDRRRLRKLFRAILRKLQPAGFAASSAWCFTRRGPARSRAQDAEARASALAHEERNGDEYIVASENYVGVGSGAFSYLDGALYATTFSLNAYEQRIRDGLTGIVTRHQLSTGDALRYTLLTRMFGLGLDREWARQRHGRKFFWRLWGELRTLELLGAADRTARGWQLTPDGMYWLMLMMSEFFESVNAYRDAMRAHVRAELESTGQRALPSTRERAVACG
ncbi:MAG: coproporphyrinogen III oxidase family protein [Opitutae bacterium]|nr:coproporphyrinogen III oxidase family protein [Opitutae bacterium]